MTKKIKYRSGAEEQFAKYLKSKGLKFQYEPYSLSYSIKEVRKYKPDFCKKIEWKTMGSSSPVDASVILEFKGRFTPSDRKKMLLVRDQYPYYDIRIVFQQDNKLSKKSKTRYSDWAKKNGFKYHVGISLPKEWLEELR